MTQNLRKVIAMKLDITQWHGSKNTDTPKEWICWNCGCATGGQWGYCYGGINYGTGIKDPDQIICICPRCGAPVYFPDAEADNYVPKALPGIYMDKLPDDMNSLYIEMRSCISVGAYTSAVLTARKLLMHIAVDMGAKPSSSFVDCAKYICENGYPGKSGKDWVDNIRKKSNEANHEIIIMSEDDAVQLLWFLELVLNGNYQAVAMLKESKAKASNGCFAD
jgi:hypothetical protein